MPLVFLLLLLEASPIWLQNGAEGWVAAGKTAAVHVTHEGAKSSSGALQFDYTVGEGMAGAVLPVSKVSLAKMDALRFWVKTDLPAPIAVILSEKQPGGNYTAICWSTGNTWQKVELTPNDFYLNTGPHDPTDPDGKLDLDSIQNLMLLDVSVVVGANPPADSPVIAESHAGKHTVTIDNLELLAGAGTSAPEKEAIDRFNTPQLEWMTLGGVDLKPEDHGLRAIYQQFEGRSIVLTRPIGHADLRGKESLAFEISSEKPAQLLLSLEAQSPGKPQGARFNALVEVPGGGKVAHRQILLSAFEHAPDSPDDELDLSRLKTLSILDFTGNTTGETAKNSLWIGNIRGVSETPVR